MTVEEEDRKVEIRESFENGSNGNPLQYSCLENPMDRGAWWAAVHGVTKSRTRLSDFIFTFYFHALEKKMATYSSKAQPLLLTLDKGYLLTTTPPDLACGKAPLGPPGPGQPPLLEGGIAPPGCHP